MKKKDFDLIISNLNKIIKRCTDLKEQLAKTRLMDMSIETFNNTVSEASQLQGEQDKITKSELYHILGMGNLTVTQQAQFICKVRKVLETRSLIKFVASQPKVKLGEMDAKHEYISSLLSGQKLVA